MKNLILLTLTWNFVLSSNICKIGNDGDEDTLYLDCEEVNYERTHFDNKNVSCDPNELDDELRESIKTIRVNRCPFNEFNLFKNCTSIRVRDVLEIKSIRKETFSEMQQLQSIEFSRTNIEVLASAFSDLPNLRLVEISGKNLNISKLAFQGAHQLKLLRIEDSSMASISPGFFRDLNNLEILNIRLESSDFSPIDFTGLDNLKLLELVKVTNVTGMFDILKNLKYLSVICDYRLRDIAIDSRTFSQMKNLIVLDLGRNEIEQLNASSFIGLTHLRTLDLSNNYINRIENGAFSTLKNLKKLDLSYNRLRALDEYTFNGLDNLQYLSLTGNRITTVHINTFSSLTKLIQLDLSRQDGLVTIDLNAFPQFIDLQGKTVIATTLSTEPDDFESAELEWMKGILSYSETANGVDVMHSKLFSHFRLNNNQDHQIDLRNLKRNIEQQTLIFGNLDLSNNRVISINVD